MKTRETTPGKTYSVHTTTGCTIIEPDGWQKTIEAPDGYFDAHFGSVVIEGDDEASIKALFKLAPQQKLALLGVLGGNDGLPAGYTRVEYLESTGRQYINSGVNPGTYVNIDITLARTKQLSSYDVFFGKNQDSEIGVSRMNIAGNRNMLQTEFGWWPNTGLKITDSQKMHITFESEIGDFEGSKATVNDEEIITAPQLTYFRGDVSTLTDPLYFYARHTNGIPSAYSCCRVYSCRIKTKTAKASFLPALDKLGTPGLYCPETKTFLTNLSRVQFITGIETQKQLDAMLRKLPDRTGLSVGTLQVRLADELQTPENEAKLDAMQAKNWEISQAA